MSNLDGISPLNPVKFAGSNLTIGEGQPEYIPLPAHRDSNGAVTTCWELTDDQLAKILITKKVWVYSLTCGKDFQPLLVLTSKPELLP